MSSQPQKPGYFFVLEGIDGSGKSTQIAHLSRRLRETGLPCIETKEPSDLPVGALLRDVLSGRIRADHRVVAGLFVADRLDHLLNDTQGILAQVQRGVSVVCDRYYFSSYAYQSAEIGMDWVISANSLSAEVLRPTLNVFLDVSPERAMQRIQAGRAHTELYEHEEQLRAVRGRYFEAFERLRDAERVAVVDASGSEDAVAELVWTAVRREIDL